MALEFGHGELLREIQEARGEARNPRMEARGVCGPDERVQEHPVSFCVRGWHLVENLEGRAGPVCPRLVCLPDPWDRGRCAVGKPHQQGLELRRVEPPRRAV